MEEEIKDYLITAEGLKSLEQEYFELRDKERPEILKVIEWAAGNGDRSENADYQYGKRRLRQIEKRLGYLSSRLKIAKVPELNRSGKVNFGNSVKILLDDLEKVYTIVGVDEIDVKLGKISYRSPLGKALMGSSIGDIVEYDGANGPMYAEILEIS